MKRFIFLIGILFSNLSFAASFEIEQWKTSNGATVLFYPTKEVPMLNLVVAFAAGSAYDGQSFGLSSLTAAMLNQGAGNMDATQVAEKLADSGAQFEAQSNRDMLSLQLKTLTTSEALEASLDLFHVILSKPTFRQDAFNQIKNQKLATIAQTGESPDEVASILFYEHVYKNHPYAHPVDGTLDTVKKITHWQVKDFYKKYFVSANATLVMVGDISSAKAHEIAETLMKSLPEGQSALAIPMASPLEKMDKIVKPFPSSQTVLRLGQLGIEHHDKDYFPLVVGNYILGGGSLVSRMALDIREKQGLTYHVSSEFLPMPAKGVFVIGLSTKNGQAQKALQSIDDILAKFIKEGPDEQELIAAKKYLVGSFPQALASNNQIASMLLRLSFYKLPKDYLNTYTAQIENVSLESIKAAFAKLIQPNKMVEVTVGTP